jgi:protein-L-isoaspartate(D-aspartate) O-methyltransferase
MVIAMTMEEKRRQLVSKLKQKGVISSKSVEEVFNSVDRDLFVPLHLKNKAYMDKPLPIGQNQTMSSPHMVAIMVEELDVKEGQTVLEIGTGSGYHSAIVSLLVGKNGMVYSIERSPALADLAERNLKKAGITNVSVIVGDGSIGYKKHAPYDRIYLTCAAPSTPKTFFDQLDTTGKLIIPVGGMTSQLLLFEKKDKKIIRHDLGGCAFMPLVGRYGYDNL